MCFDSSIGFFGVSLQSFFSRVVPLLKITWIPSFWSSLLKISENPFTYGTLKDFQNQLMSFVYFLSHQFYIYGECIYERSCLPFLLESHLQWMYREEIPVSHCDLWFLYIRASFSNCRITLSCPITYPCPKHRLSLEVIRQFWTSYRTTRDDPLLIQNDVYLFSTRYPISYRISYRITYRTIRKMHP